MKKITFDEKGTPHIKIDDAVTEAFQTDKAMKNTMKDMVNIREFGPCIELATADGGNAPALKDASQDDLLGEISARMKDKDETNAFLNKRVNEFAKSNARLTEENQRLKTADAERKRLLVRVSAFEEECSRLRGRLSQETKKRKEAEEAARDATDRLRRCEDEKREIETENVFLNAMRHAPAPTSAPGKDEIIRELIDRMLAHIEEHTDEKPKERAPMKSMITDVFRNNLTEEQWERLAALDRRGTGRKGDTYIDVHAGGMYNANVERQALDAPTRKGRRYLDWTMVE